MKKFVSGNPEELKKFAQNFAKKILLGKQRKRGAPAPSKAGLILALIGELGSGKTTFVKNFAQVLGIKEKIKSPTFIIFRKHKIPKLKFLYHFDAYRIKDEKEILNLGWKEIISDPKNIVLVEWADKIKKILPKNCVKINFKHKGKGERAIIIG